MVDDYGMEYNYPASLDGESSSKKEPFCWPQRNLFPPFFCSSISFSFPSFSRGQEREREKKWKERMDLEKKLLKKKKEMRS